MNLRHLIYGISCIGLAAVVVAGVLALYRGDFRRSVAVTVDAPRAGLAMQPGSDVKLRGVKIGRVDAVEPTSDGARLRITIDQDQAHWVRRDATAAIVPPTAFGAKYVSLTSPETSSPRIGENTTIAADDVTVEVNEAFTNLNGVLAAAQPDKVDNALTALAGGVNGRGDEINSLIGSGSQWVDTVNGSRKALDRDLATAAPVARQYDSMAPDLLATLDQATTTSRTLSQKQSQLALTANQATRLSNDTSPLLAKINKPLERDLELLQPVTDLAADYSSELPCLLAGTVVAERWAEDAVGGQRAGISTYTRLRPSREPYTYPNDLPVVGDRSGPECRGMPLVTNDEAASLAPRLQTGTDPQHTGPTSPSEELRTTFFGALAGVVNLG
ncbi:MCE family protein [Nocardioides sp. NBC_00850]|uniref:MCE family protein n=1 Tax=Nocardioides sp. NBC_00850 TaxID=2976001 RepID=UPI00386A58B9|nr:MCE family protein [Nocardioides sp. NBC_00850]